jgi:hypothetical protein
MTEINGFTLVGIAVALIVVSMLVGTQVAYHFGQVRTTTTTQNLTLTTKTRSTIYSYVTIPSYVRVSGQVLSDYYDAQKVQFENQICFGFREFLPNCIFNATVTQDSEYFGSGIPYYVAFFSIRIPNNQNYSVLVTLPTDNNSLSGNSALVLAGYIPLNTTYVNITNYDIQCLSTSANFTYSAIDCQTVSDNPLL